MKLNLKKPPFGYFYLPGALILLLTVFQCTSKEETNIASPKSSAELLAELENVPLVKVPEPEFGEPDYGVLFNSDITPVALQGIFSSGADSAIPASTEEVLKGIRNHYAALDQGLKSKMENMDVDFLSQMLDHNTPLDPKLEEFLIKMLKTEALYLPELPVIPEPDAVEEPAKAPKTQTLAGEHLRSLGASGPCAEEVENEFASGFRVCGLDYNDNNAEIESNYFRMLAEAEARFIQRNAWIQQLYDQKLLITDLLINQVVPVLKNLIAKEEFREIKAELGCLGLIYAYYLRTHLGALFEKGLQINELYLQQELKTIAEVRDRNFEASETTFLECNARVDRLIQEEIKRRCR